MAITIIIGLKIEDYGKFEKVFNEREAERVAREIDAKMYRVMDDENRVVGIISAPSKEGFMAFMTSPEQQQAMQNAGIQGPPDITFLEG